MERIESATNPPWPTRAWTLTLIGALGGAAIYWLAEDAGSGWLGTLRAAAATFIGIAALVFGHVWTRGEAVRAGIVAVVAALVVALVFLWNGTPGDGWSNGEGWRFVAANLTILIAVPLAQTALERGVARPASFRDLDRWTRDALPYAAVHGHGWTNVLTAALSLAFAGLFYLMLLLLGALFKLIHFDGLADILDEGWAVLPILGAGIGASTGLLRDRRGIVASLQGVAMAVLRVAAPVLAGALALFLGALLFTGLAPLWDATRSTTPIVLGVAIVALLLVNEVLGEAPETEARARILRWAAMILAVILVPLALIAAVSTGVRVGQYGWTPERLWAAVFIAMACLVAFSYALTLIVARSGWMAAIRRANLALAGVICLVALVLSTSLVRFDAIATADQVARLQSGRVKPDAFDYRALWFGFGPAGRAAVERLTTEGRTADIRRYARETRDLKTRYDDPPNVVEARKGSELDARLTILPAKVPLPPELRAALPGYNACSPNGDCILHYRTGEGFAVVMRPADKSCGACPPFVTVLRAGSPEWTGDLMAEPPPSDAERRVQADAVRAGLVEVREERYRRVYVGGSPIGRPIPLQEALKPAPADASARRHER